MARNCPRDPSIKSGNCSKCIGPERGMSRRAKRHSNKVDRRLLKQELEERKRDVELLRTPNQTV